MDFEKLIADAQAVSWNIMTAKEIFAELPPYPWLIKGLHIAPGRVTLLNGYADVGKTVIAMTLCLAVASGKPVWGLFDPARKGNVLHLNGEIGSYIARERYQRLARGMGIDSAELIQAGTLRLANYPDARLDERDFERRMIEVCRGVSLVVIDSLRAFSGGIDENSKEIGIALLALARVSQETGATIVVLHHNRKPSKDDVGGAKMSISGSSSILGGSECAFVMVAEEKGGPILVKHERSPIGRPMQDFGLIIEDIEKDGDYRWGLRVRHMDQEQMQEASEGAEKASQRLDRIQVEESIRVCLNRYAGVFRGSRVQLQEACACKVRKARFTAALADLIRHGVIIQGGSYHHPEFSAGASDAQ